MAILSMSNVLSIVRRNRVLHDLAVNLLYNQKISNNSTYKKIYFKRIKSITKKKEKDIPNSMTIGTTNACNAKCIMCPHKYIENIGFMNMPLFKKIVDDAASLGIGGINLSFVGEPLMDKNIAEKIKYVRKKGMWAALFSNGSLMNKKNIDEVINCGLNTITFSLDSNNKQTYEKIRKNLNFDVVKNNIFGLIEAKKIRKSELPEIRMAIIAMDENRTQLKSYYKYWGNRVDSINIINKRNWSEVRYSKQNDVLPTRYACTLLWHDFVVDWNGEVVLCCNDWNHQEVIGDLNNQSIIDVWKGKRLKEIREAHKDREFHKVPICSKCDKMTSWWLVN